MLTVEDYARIRRAHRDALSVRAIARKFHHSRRKVREALEHAGIKCDEANGGVQGLEKIESLQPDLVILDVMMPDLDGFAVCTRLRLDTQTTHLPVLMTTGLDDIASIKRAFEVGASDFLTKPITLSVLGYHVEYMLKASRTELDLR